MTDAHTLLCGECKSQRVLCIDLLLNIWSIPQDAYIYQLASYTALYCLRICVQSPIPESIPILIRHISTQLPHIHTHYFSCIFTNHNPGLTATCPLFFLPNVYPPHVLLWSSWFQICTMLIGRNRVYSVRTERGILGLCVQLHAVIKYGLFTWMRCARIIGAFHVEVSREMCFGGAVVQSLRNG